MTKNAWMITTERGRVILTVGSESTLLTPKGILALMKTLFMHVRVY